MNRLKIPKYEMIARVAEFAARNASLFPSKTAAVDLVKDLQAAVEKMAEAKAAQFAPTDRVRSGASQKKEKHETLLRQLDAIHRTAAALDIHGFSITPKATRAKLCDIARHIAGAAGPLKPQFVLHGLPSNFIENLNQGAAELRAAIESQIAARDRRRVATQEFDNALKQGMTCLQRFETLVLNTMSDNPTVMVAWEVARRLEPVRSSRKATAAVTDPSPPPPASNTATA